MVEFSKNAAERTRRAVIKSEQNVTPLPPNNRSRLTAPNGIIAKLTKNLKGGFWEASQQAWNGGSFNAGGGRTWSAASDGGRLYELNANENIEVGTIVVAFFIGADDGGFQWVFDFPGIESTTGGFTGKIPELTGKAYNDDKIICYPLIEIVKGQISVWPDPVIIDPGDAPATPPPILGADIVPVATDSDTDNITCYQVCVTGAGADAFDGTYQRVTGCRWIHTTNAALEITRDGTRHFMWDSTNGRAPDDYVYRTETFTANTCPCPGAVTWELNPGFGSGAPAPNVSVNTCGVCPGNSPNQLPGLIEYFIGDEIGLADGVAISTWAANVGEDVTGTGGNRPIAKTGIAAFNGHDVARLDGTDDFMDFSSVKMPLVEKSLFIVTDGGGASSQTILETRDAGVGQINFQYDSGGRIQLTQSKDGGGTHYSMTATPVTAGNLTFCIATFDGTDGKMFINNNTVVGSAVAAGDPLDPTGPTRFGALERPAAGQYFNGDIAEWGWFDRAISVAEINNLMIRWDCLYTP